MQKTLEIKKQFEAEKAKLFNNKEMLEDAFKLCINYSLLVEEYIFKTLAKQKIEFVLVAAGSFSRRELSPYSDIDLMFILDKIEGYEKSIEESVTLLWDIGIEISHTVREFSDIDNFLEDDLTSFTQFFETRFLIGNKELYKTWNEKILSVLDETHKTRLLNQYFADIKQRHKKYGESPKVLEPNVKSTAGGLRDFHTIEWIYSIKNNTIISNQEEITQTELFLLKMKKEKFIDSRGVRRLLNSYKTLLRVRNLLHLLSNRREDRLEFTLQEKIAHSLGYTENNWKEFMLEYFTATNVVFRFSRTLVKRYEEELSTPVSEFLSIELDDDFSIKDNLIYLNNERRELSIAEAMRGFYYRGLHHARFSQNLRSIIINSAIDVEDSEQYSLSSSVFFREILKLPHKVGETLSVMNSLGILGAFLPEFRDLIGFFQPGVYHCYTADEHTLIAIKNLEYLNESDSLLWNIFDSIKVKDTLYLSVLLHDIAKPMSISGHEIIGAEIAETIMMQLGYGQEETELVQFLVKHHLAMEQVAFRRNLNDPETLDNFVSLFSSKTELNYLYLLTYADLSAVSPVVWTSWKSELLEELYKKSCSMLNDKLSGKELLYENTLAMISNPKIADNDVVKSHVESIDDASYLQLYSHEEINEHVKEIESGNKVSVFFKEENGFTNITVITRDSESLLARLCGSLSISDLNIHDAKIFTRKDGIVIDNFNVTDFRSKKLVDEEKYSSIKKNIVAALLNELHITQEFNKIKSRWWRIENKLFKRKDKIKIDFEEYDNYSIIDVHSPDRIGMLYQITSKMNELGLVIYFAKIATKSDDVVDAFYVLDRNGNKITDSDHELITLELKLAIAEIL
ncbi:MAG: HD domain-containing protein [Melioribacteraceae bacterium]|nr:HD domain-containing protein [Melioribacteraceae bacterium]